MFNAHIKRAAFDYREPTSQSASSGRKDNALLFEKLISKLRIGTANAKVAGAKSKGFNARWALVSNADMLSVLEELK